MFSGSKNTCCWNIKAAQVVQHKAVLFTNQKLMSQVQLKAHSEQNPLSNVFVFVFHPLPKIIFCFILSNMVVLTVALTQNNRVNSKMPTQKIQTKPHCYKFKPSSVRRVCHFCQVF